MAFCVFLYVSQAAHVASGAPIVVLRVHAGATACVTLIPVSVIAMLVEHQQIVAKVCTRPSRSLNFLEIRTGIGVLFERQIGIKVYYDGLSLSCFGLFADCEEGTYGIECAFNCSCSKNQKCNNVDGSCIDILTTLPSPSKTRYVSSLSDMW